MRFVPCNALALTLLATTSLERVSAAHSSPGPVRLGPSAFTAPGVFPTKVYKAYYNHPAATSAQPQPVISDPVTVCVGLRLGMWSVLTDRLRAEQSISAGPHGPAAYPPGQSAAVAHRDLVHEPSSDHTHTHTRAHIHTERHQGPPSAPRKATDGVLLQHAIAQVLSLANNTVFGNDTCTRCQAALEVGKFLAMAAPAQGPALAVALCHRFGFDRDCDTTFGVLGVGAVVTQVVANADVGGFDGQVSALPFVGLRTWRRARVREIP